MISKFKIFRLIPTLLLLISTTLLPVWVLTAATHIILFGGGVGLNYSPNSLTVAVGDTIQWQGDFIFHPLSSTTIPAGAASWHNETGTIFNYTVPVPGTYNYHCDNHFFLGMTGSFVAVDNSVLDVPNLLLPANSSTGVATDLTFTWNKVVNAANYHIQISTTSDFLNLIQEDSTIVDTSKHITGLLNNTLYFWRVRAKNILSTSDWSGTSSFTTIPSIPAAPKLIFPDSASANQPTAMLVRWSHVSFADSFRLQLGTDSMFNILLKDLSTNDTSAIVIDLGKDSTYFWRVSAKNIAGVSPWSNTWKFTTSATSPTMTISLNDQWNMISLPLLVDDPGISSLFPTAISAAFDYSSGYNSRDSLAHGKGYWMKFSSAQNVPLIGTPMTRDTIDVNAGWNMIGSVFTKIPVSSINSIPGGIITSTFFNYNGSTYLEADSIAPGSAYWVKSSQSGKLILSATGSNQTAARIMIEQSSELPPPPPSGVVQVNMITMPAQYSLSQNFPNPFNPATVISFQLRISSWITLKVYNIIGKEIATLVSGMQDAGKNSIVFDASGLPSGIYTYSINAGSFTDTKMMLLLK